MYDLRIFRDILSEKTMACTHTPPPKNWEIIDIFIFSSTHRALIKHLRSKLQEGVQKYSGKYVSTPKPIQGYHSHADIIWPDAPYKGTVSRDFCFRFFSWIISPQAPENNTRVILNLFAPPPVSTTPLANFDTSSTGVVDTSGKFADWRVFLHLPLVLDTGGARWAANISANFRKNSKRS